jgi:hypothetical protein
VGEGEGEGEHAFLAHSAEPQGCCSAHPTGRVIAVY